MAWQRTQQLLLAWYQTHRRDLPWRDVDNPYAVLVSEFMLQQTQVKRVVPVYHAFMTRFPTIIALADATAGEVIAAWRGLGYNRRAVALHRTAVAVTTRHGGVLPDDLQQLQALPGIGEYTARAVRTFGFGHDDAPVDTNVRRVITRAVLGAPSTPAGVGCVARELVPGGQGRTWNAALMDLGSAHCTARGPRCSDCPLRPVCRWGGSGEDPAGVHRRPVAPFAGSDRWHRGRLLDALRAGPVSEAALPDAAQAEDAHRAGHLAAALVADGLAEWDGGRLRLPS